MKFRKTITITVAVIILAALPYIHGHLAKKRIHFVIAKILKLTHHTVKLEEYKIKWLYTHLRFKHHTGQLFTIKVKHGPLILTSEGFQFALAYVDYDTTELRALFPEASVSWSSDIKAKIIFPFFDDSVVSFKVKKIQADYTSGITSLKSKKRLTLNIVNMDLVVPVSDNGELKSVKISTDRVGVNIGKLKVDLTKFNYNSIYRFLKNGLQVRVDHFSLNNLLLNNSSNLRVEFNDLKYTGVAELVDALIQYRITLKAGQIEINKHKIKSSIYSLSLNNLEDQAISTLINLEDKLHHSPLKKNTPAFKKLIAKVLTRFFSTSPSAKIAMTASFPAGKLDIAFSVKSKPILFRGSTQKYILAFITNSHIKLNASSDKKAFVEVLKIWQEFKGTTNLVPAINVPSIVYPFIKSRLLDINIGVENIKDKSTASSVPAAPLEIPLIQEQENISVTKIVDKLLLLKLIRESDKLYHVSIGFKNGAIQVNRKEDVVQPGIE